MLYINKSHMDQVVSLNEMMDAIERAFIIYESKDYQMPDRMHVDRPEGTVLYMPCFANEVSGTKIVSTFPKNINQGIATVQGTMVLNNSKTSETLAIMDGASLTAYRTGAVGGVGIRHTTKIDSKNVGLIGTGVQGFFQLLYACEAKPIENIFLYDLNHKRASEFKIKLQNKLKNVTINVTQSAKELVKNSEIIITATPSENPVLPDNQELLKGKHIIAIGSYKPNMREIPESLYHLLDEVYVDTMLAAKESGDIIVPIQNGWIKPNQIKAFSSLITRGEAINKSKGTSMYKSVGMALFDLIVAETIYNEAIKHGVGQILEN